MVCKQIFLAPDFTAICGENADFDHKVWYFVPDRKSEMIFLLPEHYYDKDLSLKFR